MKCALCGSEDARVLFTAANRHGRRLLSQEQFKLCECNMCKVIWTDIKADSEYYKKYYPDDYYEDSLSFPLRGALGILKKLSFFNKARLIRRFKPKGNKLLEIGCARGEFLNSLPARFKKYGVEVNREASEFVKTHYKDITVYHGKIEEAFSQKTETFDIIVLWHVFEHIDNPLLFLGTLKKILAPNGIIIMEIPNRDSIGFKMVGKLWFHLDAPRHLFYYNYVCLKDLLARFSFKIVHYSGNPVDYFHDLSASLYQRYPGISILAKVFLLLVVMPVTAALRFFIAVFVPRLAEINMYVLRNK